MSDIDENPSTEPEFDIRSWRAPPESPPVPWKYAHGLKYPQMYHARPGQYSISATYADKLRLPWWDR